MTLFAFSFQQIKVSFQKVGHTHEGVDQMISRISQESVCLLFPSSGIWQERHTTPCQMFDVLRAHVSGTTDRCWFHQKFNSLATAAPPSLNSWKKGIKCWCISRNGISSPQHIRPLTSPAAYQNELESIQQIAKKRKKGFLIH